MIGQLRTWIIPAASVLVLASGCAETSRNPASDSVDVAATSGYEEHDVSSGLGNTPDAAMASEEGEDKKAPIEIDVQPIPTVVINDFDRARELARENGKKLLVNFTSHVCLNCRTMELGKFVEDPLLPILQNDYIEARLYVDAQGEVRETNLKLREKLDPSSLSVPFYFVVDVMTGDAIRQYGGAPIDNQEMEEFVSFLSI